MVYLECFLRFTLKPNQRCLTPNLLSYVLLVWCCRVVCKFSNAIYSNGQYLWQRIYNSGFGLNRQAGLDCRLSRYVLLWTPVHLSTLLYLWRHLLVSHPGFAPQTAYAGIYWYVPDCYHMHA